MEKMISLKEFRTNTQAYIKAVDRGGVFIVLKRSRPIFKLAPIDQKEDWEEMVDFTAIKKGGVKIDEILSRL